MAVISAELESAILAIQEKKIDLARQLLNRQLRQDPSNLEALMWACEAAESAEKKAFYLKRIVEIDPSDTCAQAHLNRLTHGESQSPIYKDQQPPEKEKSGKKKTSSIIVMASVFQVIIILLALTLLVMGSYSVLGSTFSGRTSFFSKEITISETFDQINSNNLVWRIVFENKGESTFTGMVRHTSKNHINQLPILTHDILVTAGDFADPDLVSTNVSNHHFRWFTSLTTQPKGTINLLHTVPASPEILQQLESIQNNDLVQIKGKEILVIKVYDNEGNLQAEWRDNGCNTLLVNSVTVVQEED